MTIRELLIQIGFRVDRSGAGQADSAMGSLERRANSLGSAMGALGAALGMAFALREVFQMADEWASVQARVSLTTKSAEEQKNVISSLYEIAQRTRQEFTTTADLYSKIARNADELKLSQGDILGLTEDVNKALIIGGGKTGENQAAVLQLGQALASGRLQGDEFRSLMENAPRLAGAIAKGLGVGLGELRQMSKDGELTADKVIKAIRSQSAVLNKEFEKMPVTIGQAITVSMNMMGEFFDEIEKETGIFKAIAKGIITVFTAITDGVKKAATAVGGFKNAIRLTAYAVAGLSLAMIIFSNKLVTVARWTALFRLLRMSIIATSRAAWAMMMNPLFWKAALIAAAIALIVLVIEDMYYWITGGESLLGKYLGTWEEFKAKVLIWITELKNAFFEWITSMLTSFAVWSSGLLTMFAQWVASMINGFVTFFSNVGQMWENMKNTAISILSQIGTAISTYVLSKLGWAGQALAKLAGMDLNKGMNINTNLGMAGAGAGYSNVTINQTNQLLAGTPAAQTNFVQDATKDMFDQKLVTGMQYSL